MFHNNSTKINDSQKHPFVLFKLPVSILKILALFFSLGPFQLWSHPQQSHYLLSQSGLQSTPGWSIAQRELVLSELHYSFSIPLEIEMGILFPLWVETKNPNLNIGLYHKQQIQSLWAYYLGLQSFNGNDLFNIIPQMGITFGHFRQHASLGFKESFSFAPYKFKNATTLSLSYYYSMTSFMSFVSDFQFSFWKEEVFRFQNYSKVYEIPRSQIYSLNLRFYLQNFTVQIGGLTHIHSLFLLPWLDLSYHF